MWMLNYNYEILLRRRCSTDTRSPDIEPIAATDVFPKGKYKGKAVKIGLNAIKEH